MSRRRAGALAIAILLVLTYFAFTKHIPFTHGYRVTAYFSNAVNIQPKAPVRIAGVNVGTVAKVSRDGSSPDVKVVLDLKKKALPIHTDATAKIRFRIFLEGNAFVDLKPGSPSAPVLKPGGTLPLSQTGTPVQLDQVLDAVNSDSRQGLTTIFNTIGTALDTKGTAAQNKTQDPDVKNLTGGQALNRAFRYGPTGFKGGARVFDALTGYTDQDQYQIINGLKNFSGAFNERETQLVPLIGDFATTIGAFSSDENALRQSTKQFSRLAIESEPTLRQLNNLAPALTKFSNEVAPNLDQLPATVNAAYPWIDQTTALLSPAELGTTAKLSRSTVRNFASVAQEATKTLPQLNQVAQCFSNVWYPALITKLADGSASSGVENYKEFWYSLVGWAGEAQNFTANGPSLRLGSGSSATIGKQGGSSYFGTTTLPQTGLNPALPSKNPPIRSDVPCPQNKTPNLSSGTTP